MATFNGTNGNDTIIGGADNDVINGLDGNDSLLGGDGSDTVSGGTGNDFVSGNAGTDWVEGGAGNDEVRGGSGQDSIAFHEYGAANADLLSDFDAGWDNIQLDAAAFTAIGATGRFAAGDARFYSAPGATAGHDADDPAEPVPGVCLQRPEHSRRCAGVGQPRVGVGVGVAIPGKNDFMAWLSSIPGSHSHAASAVSSWARSGPQDWRGC